MLMTVKDRELCEDHISFLHFVLKFTIKRHIGECCRAYGKVMDSRYGKQRGLAIEEIGKESIIQW